MGQSIAARHGERTPPLGAKTPVSNKIRQAFHWTVANRW
jgi:hypothetical protein